MTDHIDLDAIEKQAREAEPSPKWWDGDLVNFRCDDVLALVRAVRAARALWPLSPRESWVGTRHLYVEIGYPAERAPFAEFNAALAPFRKEEA